MRTRAQASCLSASCSFCLGRLFPLQFHHGDVRKPGTGSRHWERTSEMLGRPQSIHWAPFLQDAVHPWSMYVSECWLCTITTRDYWLSVEPILLFIYAPDTLQLPDSLSSCSHVMSWSQYSRRSEVSHFRVWSINLPMLASPSFPLPSSGCLYLF